ncbi:MAG: two-component regulator propeller domain-containing protein [Verrucomicrobiota bacterium]
MKWNYSRWVSMIAGIGLFLAPTQLVALDPSRTVYQYSCRTWTRESGLPVNSIRAITQTKDGYLWLGTQKGLVRFDGIEFQTISLPNEPQFRPGVVSCLANSGDGGLWFGVENGCVGFFDGTRFHSLDGYPWVNPQMRVGALREDSSGAFWVGAGSGLGRCFRGSTNGSAFLGQLSGISAICEDARHRIWLGTTDEGLFCWDQGQIKPFPDASLKKKAIFALASGLDGRLWVGTQADLHCYDTNLARTEPIPTLIDIKALLADQHGVVWIGTASDGLVRYQEGNTGYLGRVDGLADDFVTALWEDSEGSLWIGTREGLSQLSDVKFPIYTHADGMIGGSCHGLCASANGGIWTANTKGLSWFDGRRFINFSKQIGLVKPYVKRVFEAKNGDVYFINATRDGGREVGVLSGGKMVASHRTQNWPTAMGEDAQGVVVAVGGDLFRASRTALVPYAYRDGKIPELNWVRNLFGCKDGSLLVACVNGVFRLKDGAFEHWSVSEGLSDYDVLWVSADDDGAIWAGLETGAARIKNNQICNITQKNGLADNTIRAIVPDDHGDLWMYSSRGFLRVSRRSVNDFADGKTNQIDCVAYDGLESVKTIDTSDVEYSAGKTADGRIWFPTPPGPVMIDPNHIPTDTVPPLVHIDQVRVNGADQIGPTTTPAGPGKGELVVQYTALSYLAPQKIRFRYRLEGYDSDWIDGGNRRSVFYANLKPKPYTFVVQACSVDGVWSKTNERFAINLPPHYYQTAWFHVVSGLLGIGAILGGYAWRARRLVRKHRNLQQANEVLESRIRERTGELAEQRNLLRTLIDHLPDSVFVKDAQSRVVIDNVAHAQVLGLRDPAEAVGKTDFDCMPREQAQKFYAAEQELIARGAEYDAEEKTVDMRTGETRWLRTTKVPLRDRAGRIIGLAGINRDITERKKWEAESQSLHRKLVEASRHAGMAEVATNVLHNVGNVLNSVNVSTTLVSERLRRLQISNLTMAARLLREHSNDLGRFLTADEKGRRLPEYLEQVAQHLGREQTGLLAEIKELARNVEHINEIVAMQQTYATASGVSEIVQPADLVEDALRMNREGGARHSVKITREFTPVPPITVDRHKVIQILVNLLQNAIHACGQNDPGARQVVVRINPAGSAGVRIQVADNGIGIPPENLTRIFSHGFTTRKNGHGFGLHSGALAATELGGALTVFSGGSGKGATFTLELPAAVGGENSIAA